MTGLWSALVTPGLALPAAQPQIEFTTISAVPGLSRTLSRSATVLSGVTPHCASSSHIGRTASRSYKGCTRPSPAVRPLFRCSRGTGRNIYFCSCRDHQEPIKYGQLVDFKILHIDVEKLDATRLGDTVHNGR